MATLHVENHVHDFDEWKSVFDKFDRFREEKGMRSYRLSRYVGEPNKVTIDMDFDSVADATAFRGALEQIWTTPQSKEQLISHGTPELLDLVETKAF
jgi:hypothetical protein